MSEKRVPIYERQEAPPPSSGQSQIGLPFGEVASWGQAGAQAWEGIARGLYSLAGDIAQLSKEEALKLQAKAKEEEDRRRAVEFAYRRAQAMEAAGIAAQEAAKAGPDGIEQEWRNRSGKIYESVRREVTDPEVAARFDEWWALHSANLSVDIAARAADMKNERAIAQHTEALSKAINTGDVQEVERLLSIGAPPGMREDAFAKLAISARRDVRVISEQKKIDANPGGWVPPKPDEYIDPDTVRSLEQYRRGVIAAKDAEVARRSEDLATDMVAAYSTTGRLKYSVKRWTELYRAGVINSDWYRWGVGYIESATRASVAHGGQSGQSAQQVQQAQAMALYPSLLSAALDPTTNLLDVKAQYSIVRRHLPQQAREMIDLALGRRDEIVRGLQEGKGLQDLGFGKGNDAVLASYGLQKVSSALNSSFKAVDQMASKGLIAPKDAQILRADIAEAAAIYAAFGMQEGFKSPYTFQDAVVDILQKRAPQMLRVPLNKTDDLLDEIGDLFRGAGIPNHVGAATSLVYGNLDKSKLSADERRIVEEFIGGHGAPAKADGAAQANPAPARKQGAKRGAVSSRDRADR